MSGARSTTASRKPTPGRASMIRFKAKSLQQSEAMCGPACLCIIAASFGIAASEKQIAQACRSSRVSGTTGANMLKGARRLGLPAKIIDNADFRMMQAWMRRGFAVIVDWMSVRETSRPMRRVVEGHYSVVCGLSRTHIVLADPAIGRSRRMSRKDFLRSWFDFTHLYPKRPEEVIIRRMIVLTPREGDRPARSRRGPPRATAGRTSKKMKHG